MIIEGHDVEKASQMVDAICNPRGWGRRTWP